MKEVSTMSHFSKIDRERVELKLLQEGKILFEERGLKKVTVDEIAQKVGIGKGTFYHFYENKEHLYLELWMKAQEKVFEDIEDILRKSKEKTAKEVCYEVVIKLLEGFSKHSILISTDGNTWSKASKKVSKDYKKYNDDTDKIIFDKLLSEGIKFKYPEDVVIKLMQSSCFAVMMLLKSEKEWTVSKVLIRAIIDYIVDEGEKSGQNK